MNEAISRDPAGVLPDLFDVPSRWSALDPTADALQSFVRRLPLGRARDVLHGVWLGHPLHPALAQLPLGCWLSAGLLDLTGGSPEAARRLTTVGLVAAPAALWSGWADFAELPQSHRRTALVHAAGVGGALGLQAASVRFRAQGRTTAGRLFGLAGLAVVSVAAALGGHLAYRQSAGADHAEAVGRIAPAGWHVVGAVDDFPVGRPVRRDLGETPLLVVRSDHGFDVLADRCAHMAGDLADGELVDGCIRCPLHGSTFRLTDGRPVHGPATAPQPRFETRVLADHLEVRAPD